MPDIFYAELHWQTDGLEFPAPPEQLSVGDTYIWYSEDPSQLALLEFVALGDSDQDFLVPDNPYSDRDMQAVWLMHVVGVGVGSGDTLVVPPFKSGDLDIPKPNDVITVTVTPSSATLTVGQTQQYTAHGLDANGVEVAGLTFSWRSSNIDTAIVDENGLVTVFGVGPAVIFADFTAAAGIITGFATLTVSV